MAKPFGSGRGIEVSILLTLIDGTRLEINFAHPESLEMLPLPAGMDRWFPFPLPDVPQGGSEKPKLLRSFSRGSVWRGVSHGDNGTFTQWTPKSFPNEAQTPSGGMRFTT